MTEREKVEEVLEQLALRYLGEIQWEDGHETIREYVESNIANFAGFVSHHLPALLDRERDHGLEAKVCPVCTGSGHVPNGFYLRTGELWSTTSAVPERCPSCGGTGYVLVPADAILGKEVGDE